MKRRKIVEVKIPLSGKQAAGCDEIAVLGNDARTYVWIGKDGQYLCNFSGVATLRKLAKSILKALGEPKTDRRKHR